jgi:DNA-binding SARP family transcriptional activator
MPDDLRAAIAATAPAADELARAEGLGALVSESLGATLTHDFILVFDDLHELDRADGSLRFVETLCRQAPPSLHVVLLSRREPTFPVSRMRGRAEVLDLTAEELALDERETLALLDGLGVTGAELAERVHAITNGWPALTRLLMESLYRAAPEDRDATLANARQRGSALFTYLAEEVFGGEDQDRIDFLRHACRFDRFTTDLLEVTGLERVAESVQLLTDHGLLVRPEAGQARWFAVHSLVRDFVRDQWPLSAGEMEVLNVRAGHWFEQHDDPRNALTAFVSGRSARDVARIVEQQGEQLLALGATSELIAAAEQLPAGRRNRAVEQMLGDAHSLRDDQEDAAAWYARAAGDATVLPPGLAWRRGRLEYDRGHLDAALAIYAQGDLDGSEPKDEAFLLAETAWAEWSRGETHRAEVAAAGALDAARASGDPRALAAAHHAVALTHLGRDVGKFDYHSGRALTAAESARDVLQITRIRTNRVARASPKESLEELEPAVRLAELTGSGFYLGHALRARGLVYRRLGRFDEALVDLQRSREVYERIGSDRVAWALMNLGGLYRERGDLRQARASFEEALAIAARAHDVQGLMVSQEGLAGVLVFDDPARAAELSRAALEACRSIGYELEERLAAAGWTALALGDRSEATALAEEAIAAAVKQRQRPALAEALELAAMVTEDVTRRLERLSEAAAIWRDLGCEVSLARCEYAVGRVTGDHAVTKRATAKLRVAGVRDQAARAAGLLASLPPESAAALEIQTLGGFSVIRGGVTLPASEWQSKKARDLLKLLVARRGRPVTRETAMDLLWPGEDPGKLSNRLSVALSTLRAVLDRDRAYSPDHFVRADAASISLDGSNASVDVDAFCDAATRGLADAPRELQAAESLYVGDFLEEDPYEDWAIPLREEARALYIYVARELARRALDEGNAELAVRYTRRILERDAFDERAHFELVTTLQSSGQHGEARRAYGLYAQRMEEIGVEAMPYPPTARD